MASPTALIPTSGEPFSLKCDNYYRVFVLLRSIRSGILDTRRMLDEGMKIGLGTGETLLTTINFVIEIWINIMH